MNWTGGHLQQSKRKPNGVTAKQRSYFAKSHLRNLAAKRTAPNNSLDYQHPHRQSIKLYAQDINLQPLEPPEWLPKELCGSFLQAQSQSATIPRKASTTDKHRKCQSIQDLQSENGKAIYLKDFGIFQVPEELEDEVKRHNLLRQKDWFVTSKPNYNYQPILQDRSRIGKRRKLRNDDLARRPIQYKTSTNKLNLGLATGDGGFKPSQVSIRLGSQIHSTQRTAFSGSKVQVKTASASGTTTKESEHPLTTSNRSFQPLKENSTRSIASFQTLEEMVTPPQVSHPRAKRSKIERWISESALKGRHKDSSHSRELLDDKKRIRSPQSLDGEPSSSERVFHQQQRLSHKDIGHQNHRQRRLESNYPHHQEPSITESMKHILDQDEPEKDYAARIGPKSGRTKVCMKQTCHPVSTENVDAPTKEQSITSSILEPKNVDTDTIASLASRSGLPLSPPIRKLNNFSNEDPVRHNLQQGETIAYDQSSSGSQGPKEMPSFHSPTTSSYTNLSTRGKVGNDTAGSCFPEQLSETSLTLAQKQNEKWLQWIMKLRQRSEEIEITHANEISRQEISTSSVIPPTQFTNATPISFRSTYVHTGNTPELETLVKEFEISPAKNLECTINHGSYKIITTEGSNSNIFPYTPDRHFETPIARQSVDVSQPRTPAKPLIHRKSRSRDNNDLDSKAVNLREKFLQVASLPSQVHPKSNTKRNSTVEAPVVLPTIRRSQVKMSKEIKNSEVHAILQNDGVPLSKSVSRSLVFIKPQRFEDISLGKKIIIGHMMPAQVDRQTDSNSITRLGRGDFERDDIED